MTKTNATATASLLVMRTRIIGTRILAYSVWTPVAGPTSAPMLTHVDGHGWFGKVYDEAQVTAAIHAAFPETIDAGGWVGCGEIEVITTSAMLFGSEQRLLHADGAVEIA